MQKKSDGQNYAPKGAAALVCGPGEFKVGVVGLDHGHIYGMCNGLQEAGAEIALVYDPDPEKVAAFQKAYPSIKAAACKAQVLEDSGIQLIASAAIPCDRGPLGLDALAHGKDYFTDKPPFTTKEQVLAAREAVKTTGRKYAVYYSERLHVEAAVCAEELLRQGAIGRVIQVMGMGPHRAGLDKRPQWFFEKERYGGILTDIGCHQIEQILYFSGARDGKILSSRVANYHHKQYPELEDYGDVTLQCDNGASGYCRVDWFTPDGLAAWGDGRTFILGTDGYIELRKYIDVAQSKEGDQVIWVNQDGEHRIHAAGAYGFPYFGRLIRDCLDRTDTAMDQELVFRCIELAIEAEELAIKIE